MAKARKGAKGTWKVPEGLLAWRKSDSLVTALPLDMKMYSSLRERCTPT
jgi:hypothetical protein